MGRGLVFTFLALAVTFAVAAWIGDSPRLDVRTIEANAGR
jgi:hypothetical protein